MSIEKGVVICLVSIEMTWYVVFEGRVPGVYEEWTDCKEQVHKFQRQLLQRLPDSTRGGCQVEEAPVEQEQDEDLHCALALAHHRRSGTLFHPSVGGGRCHFICILR